MTKTSNRLTYLDWMRGLGVLIMLQGHVLDSWLRPQDRSSIWFWLSQFLGGLPAPIFLFLVGVSLALVLDRMRTKGASTWDLVSKVLRRSGWILFLAYAFRIEQFLIWYPSSKWSDVFRVDTLNCIAVCTFVVGLLSVMFKTRRANTLVMGTATAALVFLTPFIYPWKGLPSFLLSYLNGDGHSWYFSVVPWAAFTFAGITGGYFLLNARERSGEYEFFQRVAVTGIMLYAVGGAMSLVPAFEYGFFDYSLTSPHFFFIRLGWILIILYGAYIWSLRRGAEQWSPLVTLGRASLVVYWVHIEIVYGRLSLGPTLALGDAALHLLWFIPSMLLVASHRTVFAAVADFVARAFPRNAPSIENAS